MNGMSILGFGSDENDADAPPPPNRAQRRAIQKKLGAAQRRGQRAYERSLRNGNGTRVARREGDVAATEALQ